MTGTMARGPATINSPIGALILDGRATSAVINSVELTQSEGAHDEVKVQLVAPATEMNYNLVASRTAFITFGAARRGRFYGYVVDVSPMQNYGSAQRTYELTLMGVSFVMKSGRPRFFTNMGCDQVIARYAQENQLGFSDEWGQKHYIWPQLAQTDESDWEFATDLATRIGGQLICSHGVLRLIDPTNVIRRNAPLVYTSRDTNDNSTELYDFVPTHYSARLPTQFPPAIGYLANGKALVAGRTRTATAPRTFDASTPVRNQTEAEMQQLRLPVDWEEQGTARLLGDYNVEPGSVISFRSNSMVSHRPIYDGLWYVWRAQHNLTGTMYQTKVDMARVTQQIRLPPVASRFWFMGTRGRPQIVMGSNGQWLSTWR